MAVTLITTAKIPSTITASISAPVANDLGQQHRHGRGHNLGCNSQATTSATGATILAMRGKISDTMAARCQLPGLANSTNAAATSAADSLIAAATAATDTT